MIVLFCSVSHSHILDFAIIPSEAWFHFLSLTSYRELICHLHLCVYLSFVLFVIFGSVKLASLFHHVSSLVTKVKSFRVCQRLSLPMLVSDNFSCYTHTHTHKHTQTHIGCGLILRSFYAYVLVSVPPPPPYNKTNPNKFQNNLNINRKVNRKIQEVPQSQTAANTRHKEEKKKDKK